MKAKELADKAEQLKTGEYGYVDGWMDEAADMLRQQADRIAELERLVSDMIYEKSSGVYDRPQTNPEPQKVTLYVYNNIVELKTWVDEHPNEMLFPEWKYMGKIEVLK
jgi:hypothetical protein